MSRPEINVLFIGNSHTAVNNVPEMVSQLARTADSGPVIRYEYAGVSLLNAAGRPIYARIGAVKWDFIVLQGEEISSSHKYTYSQEGGIGLAKAGVKAGATVLLFAEWPRRGWDETEYINDVYRGIAKASGAKVVSVGVPWDKVLKLNLGQDLWSSDGNHASLHGSYIAARTLYRAIVPGGVPDWKPNAVSVAFARALNDVLPPAKGS